MNVQDKVYQRQAGLRRLLLIGLSVWILSITQVAQAGEHYPGCGSAHYLKVAVNNSNSNGEPDYIGLEYEGCIYDLDETLVIEADGGNPVTIEGNGAIISGVNAVRVFHVKPGATLILQNVTVRDGKSELAGAGIASSGTVALTNVTLSGNRSLGDESTSFGGAVFSRGTLTVTNSTLYGNSAIYGGGIANTNGGTMTITNSTIQGNTATKNGGGIYQGETSSLTVTNSFVTLNVANESGGGISNDGTMTLNGDMVSGNIADSGGGIFSQSGRLTLTDSRVQYNTAEYAGGGLYNYNGVMTVADSTVFENSGGGGILGVGGSSLTTVINTTVAFNSSADGGGGGISMVFGELRVTNTTVAFNFSVSGTGGLQVIRGTTELGNTILVNNQGGDCGTYEDAVLTVTGRNLVGDGSCSLANAVSGDPGLAAFTDERYYALLPGSKAIDGGSSSICPPKDQRGATRPMDGDGDFFRDCDLGAYEADTVVLPTATTGATATPGGATSTPQMTSTPDLTMTATPTGTIATATATLTGTAPAPTATATTPALGTELLANGDFELMDATQKPVLTPWTVKNGSGDKLKCNKPAKLIANSGNCAFRFKGNVGENAKLVQSVVLENFTFATGETLDLSMFINASSPAVSGKLKLSVKYTDTTLAADKVSVALRPTTGYENFGGQVALKSGNLAKIKLQVSHRGVSGKVYVDTVSLRQVGVESLLPLP